MRILLMEGSGRGFLCQYSHALAMGLQEIGEQVRLLTGARDELAGWSVPFDKQACLAGGMSGWRCLRRQVSEFRPDVVHVQWIDRPLAALTFTAWAQSRGISVVYTPHNILPHERRWISLPLYRALYRRVDQVIARDRHLSWALEELLDTPQERVTYLPGSPNPLALDDFPSASFPELDVHRPGEFRAVFFGHGCDRKGLDGFLEVVAARDWPENLRLLIAGEGVLAGVHEGLVRRACDRLRISVIDRYLTPAEVKHLFSQGDLLVMPYRKQCKSPLIDLAAAFAMPVLRSDRVQGSGLRDGLHGLSYPHERPELLGGILQGLAEDPGAMKMLRDQLRRRESVGGAIRRLAVSHVQVYTQLSGTRQQATLSDGLASYTAGSTI